MELTELITITKPAWQWAMHGILEVGGFTFFLILLSLKIKQVINKKEC